MTQRHLSRGPVTRAGGRLWYVCVLAVPLLAGEAPAPTPTPAGASPATEPTGPSSVRFRALEVHDQREALADILHRLALERDERRREHRAVAEAIAKSQTLRPQGDGEAALRAGLALDAAVRQALGPYAESRLRRLALIDQIQAQSRQAMAASAESVRFLRDADREVRQMLALQDQEVQRLRALSRGVAAFLMQVPPPPRITGPEGIEMRLVGTGSTAFYVSLAPIPVRLYRQFLEATPAAPGRDEWAQEAAGVEPEAALTGVSWYEAQRLCQWLSARGQAEYRLPAPAEAEIMAASSRAGPQAFWGGNEWIPSDHALRRDLRRFGIRLASLCGGAGPATVVGELPFARSAAVTVYLVTSLQTGIAQRWQRVKSAAP